MPWRRRTTIELGWTTLVVYFHVILGIHQKPGVLFCSIYYLLVQKWKIEAREEKAVGETFEREEIPCYSHSLFLDKVSLPRDRSFVNISYSQGPAMPRFSYPPADSETQFFFRKALHWAFWHL